MDATRTKYTAFFKTRKGYILRTILNVLAGMLLVFIFTRIAGVTQYRAIMNNMMITALAVLAVNLVNGCLGELALGHAAFLLIGGTMSAAFTKVFAARISSALVENGVVTASGYLDIVIAILIGAISAGIIGYIIGVITLGRLKGDYFCIITLAFGFGIVSIFNNLKINYLKNGKLVSLINGSAGVSLDRATSTATPLVIAIVLVASVVLMMLLIKSRHGRAVLAIRDDAIAAEASGIPVKRYKVWMFTISAIFTGIAGVLYWHCNSGMSVFPINYSMDKSIELFVMVVLGGMGSFTGSILSAFGLTFLVKYLLINFGTWQKLVYSLILLATMFIRPKGIMGTAELTWEWIFTTGTKIGRFFKRLWFRVFKKRRVRSDAVTRRDD